MTDEAESEVEASSTRFKSIMTKMVPEERGSKCTNINELDIIARKLCAQSPLNFKNMFTNN